MELTGTASYQELVGAIKQRISRARIKAALAANTELIRLYWDIGRMILEQQEKKGWGAKVTEYLSKDLKQAFPGMKGLSDTNLRYMRRFSKTYPDLFRQQAVGELEFRQQLVGELPWGHNLILLEKLGDNKERLWYSQKAVENGWSRNVLAHQIESGLYERQEKAEKISNFKALLPQEQSELAEQTLKSPYLFDFLNLPERVAEQELEQKLIEHIGKFLLELGQGFAFIANQYHLEVGGDDFYIDLLVYNYKMKCFWVIELKTAKFEPKDAGQLNFYVNAIDQYVKQTDDQPTIGILLCPEKNNVVTKLALGGTNKPIGVSEYKLKEKIPENFKGALQSIEALEDELKGQFKERE